MEHEQPGALGGRSVTRPPLEVSNGHGEMSHEDPEAMLHTHHQQTLWVYFALMLLGVWLSTSPFTFGYGNPSLVGDHVARVTAERNLPDIASRQTWMIWSDVISGVLLLALAALSLNPRRLWAPWAACFVGIWLLFAPLVFWAPVAAAYTNDTLIGILVIALTVLVPGMPGMMLIMKMGPEAPPGWSYNPSSWVQRAPIIALGWVGFFASRYLATYQLGYIDGVWDPFFGASTERILDSDVSRAWPISDAGLGTVAYALEALMGYMGCQARWRTMPWMVLVFGILVVPLGLVSITLVILQPVAVGTWGTLCLLTALTMLVMIPLTLDEVVAMSQFVVQKVRGGSSLWRTFWKGDTIAGEDLARPSPGLIASLLEQAPASVWGVTVPWSLLLSAALGLWLLAAPDVLGIEGRAGNNTHLVGAAIAVVAVIALAEVVRAGRWLNIPLGLWIVITPWVFGETPTSALWNSVIAGLVVAGLSCPRGPVRERYGGWDRYVV
ncbi:MAG: SPW repeat protein [Chloroflexi bacterium]|nr:SPW repeat protein [Chloroflexota bacterium]